MTYGAEVVFAKGGRFSPQEITELAAAVGGHIEQFPEYGLTEIWLFGSRPAVDMHLEKLRELTSEVK